jgi:hypothetical protein
LRSRCAPCSERTRKLIGDRATREFGGACARDYEKIHPLLHLLTPVSEKFTDVTFDPVARDCIAYFAADRDPQPTLARFVSAADDNEICRVNFAAGFR